MRRIAPALAVLVVLVVLGGCGGTDWNTAQVSPAAPPRPVSTAASERPYIDALVASAQSQATKPELGATAVRCVATAIVHGYGAPAFVAANLTPTDLRDPNSTLTALPALSDDQGVSIGTALQHCNVGGAVAMGFAQGLKVTDGPTVSCLAGRFATDPGARRFLALSVLQRHADIEAAHALIGLVAACVDLPTLVLRSANVQVDATTRACILDALKTSEAQLKDLMALKIAGLDATQQQETLAVSINDCRASARTGFTVPTG
jgi:hypothetical protein